MDIVLDAFDECIDEVILKRGLSYFRNGLVREPVEVAPGEYETTVEGTEEYSVRLRVQSGVVVEHECSCPYDMGPVCKHVAALLFCLRQEELGLKKKKPRKSASKPKSAARKVDELLERAPHDELRRFVRDQARESAAFRRVLMASLAAYAPGDPAAVCRSQLKAVLRSARGWGGFIDWRACAGVGEAAWPFLDAARSLMEAGDGKAAMRVCTTVMELMVSALEHADDSDGVIGNAVDDACGMLSEMAVSDIGEDLRRSMLDYCFTAVEKRLYAGWDWHAGMLEIAAELVGAPAEVRRLLDVLEREQEEESSYVLERAQSISYALLRRTEGEEVARAYMESRLGNYELRRLAIRQALDGGEHEKARRIALEGVAHDGMERPGLATEWRDWLLKIAEAVGDRREALVYARELFLESVRPERDYYAVMKAQVAPEEWPVVMEELIRACSSSGRWWAGERVRGIFVREGLWERLLADISLSPDFHVIAEYEPHLSGAYAPELVELYAGAVEEYLKERTGRTHYREACRYLRRMIKLGGRARAGEVASLLRKAYPSRRALLEELERL